MARQLDYILLHLNEYNPQVIRSQVLEKFSPAVVAKCFDRVYKEILADRHFFDKRAKA